MGTLQINQIRARLLDAYDGKIATEDSSDPDVALLTRGLAAWVIQELSGCSETEAADAVTDGAEDNGIDALYIDRKRSLVYLVQSKWRESGRGSMELGDVLKFINGFRDLVNAEFERFNNKLTAKQPQIEEALGDPDVKFAFVLAHTGSSPLSKEAERAINDVLVDANDPIETVTFQSLTQTELHAFLRRGVRGAQPDLRVTLYEWGSAKEPYAAHYGQVDAASIAEWYADHRTTLFDRNIREFLGRSSEVNNSLLETLRSNPQHFWYLNNGVTILCDAVSKAPKGSTMKRSGVFEFKGASVVNGAQTVGCIGEAALDDPSIVADARVMVRFISLEACPPDFASEVTRGTNTQNRVERRDFVALDKEQIRLREELAIDKIDYVIKSGDVVSEQATGFSIVEATTALACAHNSVEIAVQAKREIGRLWAGAEGDFEGSMYRQLFNASISGQYLWRRVRVLRAVEQALDRERKVLGGRERQIGIHGNRIIAHLVFKEFRSSIDAGVSEFDASLVKIPEVVNILYSKLREVIERDWSGNYLASLFKNVTRCRLLVESMKEVSNGG